jgi:hypothetical protein
VFVSHSLIRQMAISALSIANTSSEPKDRGLLLVAGLSVSRTILDVPKVISLIINELYSKDFMPYGNG